MVDLVPFRLLATYTRKHGCMSMMTDDCTDSGGPADEGHSPSFSKQAAEKKVCHMPQGRLSAAGGIAFELRIV